MDVKADYSPGIDSSNTSFKICRLSAANDPVDCRVVADTLAVVRELVLAVAKLAILLSLALIFDMKASTGLSSVLTGIQASPFTVCCDSSVSVTSLFGQKVTPGVLERSPGNRTWPNTGQDELDEAAKRLLPSAMNSTASQ